MKAHLEVEAPSSTTINYLVTSKKRPTSRILEVFGHGVRVVVIFHVLIFVISKAQLAGLVNAGDAWAALLFRATILDAMIYALATRTEWWMAISGAALMIWLCLRRPSVEESLLVLQGLGIQTSTSSPYYFVGPTTTFTPTTKIQDIVIHEAFEVLEVKFYLAVIVEGATEVVVVFPTLLPRLDILQEVWRGARRCLYKSPPKPG